MTDFETHPIGTAARLAALRVLARRARDSVEITARVLCRVEVLKHAPGKVDRYGLGPPSETEVRVWAGDPEGNEVDVTESLADDEHQRIVEAVDEREARSHE